MFYTLTTHSGEQLLAHALDASVEFTQPADDIGIGTILVTDITGMTDVAVPFVTGWMRYGNDVQLIPPTTIKPYYITVEFMGKMASFPLPMLEYYGADEILILADCGLVLKNTSDISKAATFAFGWATATHEWGFWKQLVNGVHCFADMLRNYAVIPAKVRPSVRDFMNQLPLFPLNLRAPEAVGFYIGCRAPFSMMESFNIELDFNIMRKVVLNRTFSGITFPDWFDPYYPDLEHSLWARTDELYLHEAQAGINWLFSLCPEAEGWEARLRERAFAERSLCEPFLALLLEKAKWTAMGTYTQKQCALCAAQRRQDSILCEYHWALVAPHEDVPARREAARIIALTFHQFVILGFEVTLVRMDDQAEGVGIGVHCVYPDACRLTIDTPIRLTGGTLIEEWMERLVKHKMTHHLQRVSS